ncbi:hypothetical protein M8C21_006265 [Ambrosia artemisiifolia]|uniref:CSC1/OSCA1-like cytosolic domain-containing protein n=1 Tax=Ambrosia artemisiifolia TaxID=4212 RepID=A0AAD5CCC5_AMBAR|nr:hypothetical protein M8C21_006265 [Ambrosia artemisiifolia]
MMGAMVGWVGAVGEMVGLVRWDRFPLGKLLEAIDTRFTWWFLHCPVEDCCLSSYMGPWNGPQIMKDWLVKVVSFVLSLLDIMTKPILILASSDAILLWEIEFSKWSKSIKVVAYKGNKDIRDAITDSKFQVLLSSPDDIVEDMEMFDLVKWELRVPVPHIFNTFDENLDAYGRHETVNRWHMEERTEFLLITSVLVRHVPSDPDESVSEHVEHFFCVNHLGQYVTHKVVYNVNKLVKMVMEDIKEMVLLYVRHRGNHLQKLKMMDPVDVETKKLFSSDDAGTGKGSGSLSGLQALLGKAIPTS